MRRSTRGRGGKHEHLLAAADELVGGGEDEVCRFSPPGSGKVSVPPRAGVVLGVRERPEAEHALSQLDRAARVDQQPRDQPIRERLHAAIRLRGRTR